MCNYWGVGCDNKDMLQNSDRIKSWIETAFSVSLIAPLEEGLGYSRSLHIFLKYVWAYCWRIKTSLLATLCFQKPEWRTQLNVETCLSFMLNAAAEWFLHNIRMWFMFLFCSITPVSRLCSHVNCNLYKILCSRVVNWSTSLPLAWMAAN